MSWVDHKSYFGPDRRAAKRGLRLIERRREDTADEPLSLAAAARRLNVWSIDAESPAKAARLSAPLSGMAALLRYHYVYGLAERVDFLGRRVRTGESGAAIAAELRFVAERLAAGPRLD
jgi:hypothetical protein